MGADVCLYGYYAAAAGMSTCARCPQYANCVPDASGRVTSYVPQEGFYMMSLEGAATNSSTYPLGMIYECPHRAGSTSACRGGNVTFRNRCYLDPETQEDAMT